MWPRIVEFVLGSWLLGSPWVLAKMPMAEFWRSNSFVCGLAIVALSALSFWRPLQKVHLAEILIAGWLIGVAYVTATHPASALVQSDILVGLFLLNFAIIPSEANRPPVSWRTFRDIHSSSGSNW